MKNLNGYFSLAKSDFIKGLITAVFSAIVIAVYGVVNTPNFDFFMIDWNMMVHNVVNVGVATLIGYLAKNFLSNREGTIAGIIKTE